MKPRLLDLFCGAGGAGMGYHRAGFEVVGIDIAPQPHYPFAFEQADALAYMAWFCGGNPSPNRDCCGGHMHFDAIHASPPCQAYTQATLSQRNAGKVYPDLLGPTRDLLNETRLPWVIENVPGAPMRADLRICGCQVGLKLRRVRWFETSWHAFDLAHPCHHAGPVVSVVGHGTPSWVREQFGFNPTIKDYREAMGIDWMNRNELSEAIPPAYTAVVGAHLLAHLEERRAA
jgi:DNA (cytosine-5)-methyltransferase 1